MKILSILVLKNEADIVEYNLRQAAYWSDYIFVLDNGSSDGSWELVQQLAKENPKIIAWKQWAIPFYDGIRSEIFRAFRHLASPGDWWCLLASDEFYIDDPRAFLTQVPTHYHAVCKDALEYRLTWEDLDEYAFSGHFPEDLDKIRYYHPNPYAEVRFFRHRARLKWAARAPFPHPIGIVYPNKIRSKHYQYRSLPQMELRFETREQARLLGGEQWAHIQEKNHWEQLKHRSELVLDTGSYPTPSPFVEPRWKYWAKRFLHGLGIWA